LPELQLEQVEQRESEFIQKPRSHSVHWISVSDQHCAVLQFSGGWQFEEGCGEGSGEGSGSGDGCGDGLVLLSEHILLSVVPVPGQGVTKICPGSQGVQREQAISL